MFLRLDGVTEAETSRDK